MVGERTSDDAEFFLTDLASRLEGRVQLSTDGHRIYEGTIGPSFRNNVDWAQIQKHYATGEVGKYSPAVCIGTKRRATKGGPDPARISTSYVERQNLTMRMGMRRFTRLDQRVQPQGRERSRLVAGRDRRAAGLIVNRGTETKR